MTAVEERAFGGRVGRVVLTTATKVTVVITTGACAVISAHLLHPGGRGAYSLLMSLATTTIALGHLSLEQAHVYLWSEGADRRSLASNGIALGLGIGSVVATVAYVVVHALGPRTVPVASDGLLLLVLATVPLQIVVLYTNGFLVLDDRINRVNVGGLVGAVLLLGGTLGLAAAHRYTLHTLMYLLVATLAVPLAVNVTAFEVRRRHLSRRLARRALGIGVRYHLGMAALFLLWRVDVLLLSARVSAAQVGLYSVAVALVELVYLLTDTVAQVMLPRQITGSLTSTARLTADVMRANAVLAAVAVSLAVLASPVLVPLVFGASFGGSVAALVALCPGVLALAAIRPVGGFLIRLNQPLRISAATGSALALNVVLNLVLIPVLGIVGASLASSVAYTYLAVVYLVWLMRAGSVPPSSLVPRRSDLVDPALEALRRFRRRRAVAPVVWTEQAS